MALGVFRLNGKKGKENIMKQCEFERLINETIDIKEYEVIEKTYKTFVFLFRENICYK